MDQYALEFSSEKYQDIKLVTTTTPTKQCYADFYCKDIAEKVCSMLNSEDEAARIIEIKFCVRKIIANLATIIDYVSEYVRYPSKKLRKLYFNTIKYRPEFHDSDLYHLFSFTDLYRCIADHENCLDQMENANLDECYRIFRELHKRWMRRAVKIAKNKKYPHSFDGKTYLIFRKSMAKNIKSGDILREYRNKQ